MRIIFRNEKQEILIRREEERKRDEPERRERDLARGKMPSI